MTEPLLEIRNLAVTFNVRGGEIRAVDGMNLEVHPGCTLGVIGESGCGKSMTARAILNMVARPGRMTGQILYRPTRDVAGIAPGGCVDILALHPDGEAIRRIRGGEIGLIFQEPMSSLTPVYSAGTHLREAIWLHRHKIGDRLARNLTARHNISRSEARTMGIELLRQVGIPHPEQRIDSYPHQLSGGQRQRVMIAVALSCEPSLLIADEPTTALDVSIEAQILDLMRDLQARMGMAILFISHNLGVIAEMAEEVVVMYLGRQVERASTQTLFESPLHPYTRALLRSIPRLGQRSADHLATIEGAVPDALHVPAGCAFHPRCPQAIPGRCDRIRPTSQVMPGQPGHEVACLLYESVA